MRVLVGIDIGYLNMGISVCHVEDDLDESTLSVEHVAKINLRYLRGKGIHEEVDTFVKEFILPKLTEKAVIMVERQPPTGLTAIEYLILHILKDYTIVRVAPNSLHKQFQIGHLCYEKRKEFIEKYVEKYFTNTRKTKTKYDNMTRKHDVADSILFCLFYCRKNKISFKNVVEDFELFRFVPSHQRV